MTGENGQANNDAANADTDRPTWNTTRSPQQFAISLLSMMRTLQHIQILSNLVSVSSQQMIKENEIRRLFHPSRIATSSTHATERKTCHFPLLSSTTIHRQLILLRKPNLYLNDQHLYSPPPVSRILQFINSHTDNNYPAFS